MSVVKINKQKTASAVNEKKTANTANTANTASKPDAAAGTKFARGKKVDSAKPETKTAEPKAKNEKQLQRHVQFTARVEYMAKLCLAQKYLDTEIIEMTTKAFPDYKTPLQSGEAGRARWMLNNDLLPNIRAEGRCFARMFMIDGKLTPKADKPKGAFTKRKQKYTTESDPLTGFNINVHGTDKKEEKTETAPKIKKVKKTVEANTDTEE
jgi:hypothetical protein